MPKVFELMGGLILIGIAFLIFIFAMPSMNSATLTGSGTAFENNSEPFKMGMSAINTMLIFFPFILLFVGIIVIADGFRR
jgi:hypothetical protein